MSEITARLGAGPDNLPTLTLEGPRDSVHVNIDRGSIRITLPSREAVEAVRAACAAWLNSGGGE